eukprot:GHVU01009857.1.p1 GENE.GHVU01009857.1~~GHVU01009857.1.p1  ORF type:complete len:331 (+),score=50.35 GHVU01009857.1:830-1822(+)
MCLHYYYHHAQLRDRVAEFAEREIAPVAHTIDREDAFPRHLWPKLGAFGVLGVTAPEQYGGLGLKYIDHVLAMEQLSRCSGSVGLSYGVHSELCVNQLVRCGSSTQKDKYLPPLISGEHVGALAISERESGSDMMSLATTAEDKGDHFVLRGSKMWITNAPVADTFIIHAKTSSAPKDDKKHGIAAFIVERGFKGLKVGKGIRKLGMRGSPTAELFLDECKVPKENVLGGHTGVDDGAATALMPLSALDSGRLVLAGGPLGLMQACLDEVVPHVNRRRQFSTPIADFQVTPLRVHACVYTCRVCACVRALMLLHDCVLLSLRTHDRLPLF